MGLKEWGPASLTPDSVVPNFRLRAWMAFPQSMPEYSQLVSGLSETSPVVAGFLDGTPFDPARLPEIVRLPAWADPQLLRSLSAVAVGVSIILIIVSFRLVRRLLLRIVVTVLFAALSIGLWEQRVDLGSCAASCDCSLFGQEVSVPYDLNPLCS